MTDNDIKKALEICIDFVSGGESMCKNCPLYDCNNCSEQQRKQALDLINRQQAEIERLQKLLSGAKDCIDEIEYAMDKVGTSNDRIDEALEEWNNLVKEMTEVSKDEL